MAGQLPLSAFFHKGISRLRSEELLLLSGKDGSYLVRDSESVANAYVLCVFFQSRVHQYRILPNTDGRFSVESEGETQCLSFSDLHSLILVYVSKVAKNGLVCPLLHALASDQSDSPGLDSEDDNTRSQETSTDEDRSCNSDGNFKYGLLHNFARLNLSTCDNEFVDALKNYVDHGLDCDASKMRTGQREMLELQSLLQTAGMSLLRELDIFLLKLSMVQDILALNKDDHQKSTSVSVEMNGPSYISFLCAKLQQGKSKLQEVNCQAEEVLDKVKQNAYDYPEEVEVCSNPELATPCLTLDLPSVRIPLSAFEVKLVKAGKMLNQAAKVNLNVDMRHGRVFAVQRSKDLLDSSNTFAHDKILQLVKNTVDSSRLDMVLGDRKKLTCHFDGAHERENFCLLVRKMKMLHSQEMDVDNISIFIGTWNMGKSPPVHALNLWLRCCGSGKCKDRTLSCFPHDLYVIGTQESAMTEKDWISMLKATLKATLMTDVDLLESCTLWGLRLVVLMLPKHRNRISHVQKSSVRTGIANALGNKGAAAVSCNFNGTSLCFINSHLTSGAERLERRNANYRDIIKGLKLGTRSLDAYDVTHKFHHVFFFGDLNYRVEDSLQSVLTKVENRDLECLLEKDQLQKVCLEKRAFCYFNEAPIKFMPTYRLERHNPGYKYDWRKMKKMGERINIPSWCDRVLWHSFPGTFIDSTAYGSVDNILSSDHRPVFASFVVGVTSEFVESRTALKDTFAVSIGFTSIQAQIQTSFKQCFVLEFSSSCLLGFVHCQSNKAFGDWQKPGMCSNPVWDYDELPMLRPMFSDVTYLEDQHLLVAVKGASDEHEVFGECILSLKGMFDSTNPRPFECPLTHHGEETGQIRGSWFVHCSDKKGRNMSRRKTYDVIALDTEYQDAEAVHTLSSHHHAHCSSNTPSSHSSASPPQLTPHRSSEEAIPSDGDLSAFIALRPQAALPTESSNHHSQSAFATAGDSEFNNNLTASSSPLIHKWLAKPVEVLPKPSDSQGTASELSNIQSTLDDLSKPQTIVKWLEGLDLVEYLPLFLQLGCDSMASVVRLSAAQVMKMGIRCPEHRTRLLHSVHQMTKHFQNTDM